MWVLSCDGELFSGRVLWLRPGSNHLLGRTSGRPDGGERVQYIDHRTVSRKHLIVSVSQVKPGDSGRLLSRTVITLTDGSKTGTTVNGDKFMKEKRTLDSKTEYNIKLGSYEHLFRLAWKPVVLSFTNLSKGSKSKGDALAAYKEKLEGTDVRLATDYVTNETTHVVAKKRNNPTVLQALVQARWVVTDAFVDSLAAASRRGGVDANGDPKISPLEDDFETNWPKEYEFLVPAGPEPVPREDEYLKPNLDRSEVFHDYSFVFLSQSQQDNLLPVITSGGGKAVVWEFEPGRSRVEDCMEYVKGIAGKKGHGQFRLSQHPDRGGVVMVRMNERRTEAKDFIYNLDLALDQRSIEQSEFLDAILTIDASHLRRSLPELQNSCDELKGAADAQREEENVVSLREKEVAVPLRGEPAAEEERSEAQQIAEEQPVEQPPTAGKKRNRRIITQSRFRGFNDFDPSQFTRAPSQSPEPSFRPPEPSQAPSVQSMDVDGNFQRTHIQQTATGRKRAAPVEETVEEDGEEEGMYESILTGQAAYKRRRTEAVQGGEKAAFTSSSTRQNGKATEAAAAKQKQREKEVDVKAELRARREHEEEQRRKDEEALQESLGGISINEVRNLVKVDEMEIPVRELRQRVVDRNGQSQHWDPAWNGRKNFKKFRPQGQHREGPKLQRVIVTLQEVPKKGHGIGDEYWLTSHTQSSKSNTKRHSQSQPVRQGPGSGEDGGDGGLGFRRRLQISREEDIENALDERNDPVDIAGLARDPTLAAAVNSTPSQTFGTESQRKAAGKRLVTQQGGGPGKKAKQTLIATNATINLDDDDDDDDDDDGLKFRRRKR